MFIMTHGLTHFILLFSRSRKQNIRKERRLLHALRHPFIVNRTFTAETPEYVYIGMEVAVCDLHDLIHTKAGPMAERDCRVYGAQVIMAVDYLHSVGWLHRDIKPGNVLLMSDGYVKLTDFGLAKYRQHSPDGAWRCGTRGYMAPEVASGRQHTRAMDVWSLGVTLYELMTRDLPFRRQPTLEDPQEVIACRDFSDELAIFIDAIFEVQVEFRPSCRTLLKCRWFRDLDMDRLFYKELPAPYIM